MKFIFSRFTFLTVALFFFINHSIVANNIHDLSFLQKEIPERIVNDSTKKSNQSNFLLENNTSKHLLQNNSNTKGKFELGLEFGLFSTDIGYSFSYKMLTRGIQVDGYKLHHSTMTGLSLTHQLSKKWWLQTGIRYGRSTWSDDVLFEALYNKSIEQILPNGEIRYDLILISSGSLNESETKINVSMTNASSLDDGDFIVSSLLVENRLDWVQIPIGLVYRLGRKRLNYEIKGGLSLNQIRVSNYHIDGLIEGAVSIFNINEITYPPSDNKRFLGTYLSAGLRYNLKKNIILNTNFNIRYEPSIKFYVNDVFTAFHLGASYLF